MTQALTEARDRAAKLRAEAEATRAAAWATFEAQIYAAPAPAESVHDLAAVGPFAE